MLYIILLLIVIIIFLELQIHNQQARQNNQKGAAESSGQRQITKRSGTDSTNT